MATPSSAIQLDGWDFARVSVTRSWTYGFLSDGNDARGWTPNNLRRWRGKRLDRPPDPPNYPEKRMGPKSQSTTSVGT